MKSCYFVSAYIIIQRLMDKKTKTTNLTISNVAERAGVSTATVSRVINNTAKVSDKDAERVLAAIAELNY